MGEGPGSGVRAGAERRTGPGAALPWASDAARRRSPSASGPRPLQLRASRPPRWLRTRERGRDRSGLHPTGDPEGTGTAGPFTAKQTETGPCHTCGNSARRDRRGGDRGKDGGRSSGYRWLNTATLQRGPRHPGDGARFRFPCRAGHRAPGHRPMQKFSPSHVTPVPEPCVPGAPKRTA